MIDAITGLIGGLLYPIFSLIFLILDLLQSIFMAMAGIGANKWFRGTAQDITLTYGNTGNKYDSGLIFYILNTDMVKNLLMSITLLAVFLLIIFTVMAFIKNAYSTKPKTWQDIVANALKGLISFVFVPVCCLLGVWVSNIVLNAINGATSTGGSVKLSRKLFITCAYNANTYRIDTTLEDDKIVKRVYGKAYPDSKQTIEKDKNEDGKISDDETEIIVDLPEKPEGYTTSEWYATIIDNCYADETSNLDIYWWKEVEQGYSLYQINYLFLIIVGIFMMSVMVTLTYAMVRRIFFLAMLFVISPALCAMYPLDDGAMVGKWRTQFISTTISAYGAVAGMNIFFSLLPLIEHLSLTSISGHNFTLFMDEMFQLFMLVAGLYIVKEFMSTISSLIGGEDAYGKGSQLKGNVNKHISAKKLVGGAFTFGATWKTRRAQLKADGKGNAFTRFFSGVRAGFDATVFPTVMKESGIGDYIKTGKEGIDAGIAATERERQSDILSALRNDLMAANGVRRKTAKGYEGLWDASASRDDLIKIAEKLGLKDPALKGAGINPEYIKEDNEIKKTLEDNIKALQKLSDTIQLFERNAGISDAAFSGKHVDEIATMPKVRETDEASRQYNAIIDEAQRLNRERIDTIDTYEKTRSGAVKNFHDSRYRTQAGNMATGTTLKGEHGDTFATSVSKEYVRIKNENTDYVDSTGTTVTYTTSTAAIPAGDTFKEIGTQIGRTVADAIVAETRRQNFNSATGNGGKSK